MTADSWLGNRVPSRAKPPRPPDPPGDAPTVEYYPVRCPNAKCQSDKVPVYCTRPWQDGLRIRYHKCERCRCLFKSVETKGDSDAWR